jgi:hypothetical protein
MITISLSRNIPEEEFAGGRFGVVIKQADKFINA